MADNPWANDNPFSSNVNGSVPAASGSWGGGGTAGAWGGGGGGAAVGSTSFAAPSTVAVDSSDVRKMQERLEQKERELARKESELQKLEIELRNSPAAKSVKNWPKFCPIAHHDIAGEIPAHLQVMVKFAYWSFLGLVLCLLLNWIGCLVAMTAGGRGWTTFLWGTIYVLGGVPGAFVLWYMRLYNASIKDSAFGYAIFFLGYLANVIFCAWSAIAPPIINQYSHTGFWVATEMLDSKKNGNPDDDVPKGVAIYYYVAGAFWAIECAWCIWVLKLVYAQFRGRGGSFAAVRQEASGRAVSSAARGAAARGQV